MATANFFGAPNAPNIWDLENVGFVEKNFENWGFYGKNWKILGLIEKLASDESKFM